MARVVFTLNALVLNYGGSNQTSIAIPGSKHEMSKETQWLGNSQQYGWSSWQVVPCDVGRKLRRHGVFSTAQRQGHALAYDYSLEVGLCSKLCEDGRVADAVEKLYVLVERGCHVANGTLYRVLKRCIAKKDLDLGGRVHTLIIKSGYGGDAFLATHLIGLYASGGRLEEAKQVFARVPSADVYNWAAIIFAHARHGEAAQAIRLYRQMLASSVEPNNRVYLAVLQACATAGDVVAGREVHAHILASPEKPDIFVQTGLVNMYAKCRSLEDARRVFDSVGDRNLVTWNAMLAGYAQQGMGHEALTLYHTMPQSGILPPNCVTFVCLLQACASVGTGALQQGRQLHLQIEKRGLQDNSNVGCSLVNMYAKCGSLEDARIVFNRLQERSAVAWTTLIAGYVHQGMGEEALRIYSRMQQEGVTPPDTFTFVCLLQTCALRAALSLGEQLHAQIKERGMQADVVVGAALVNMYAKCGSMLHAQQVFNSLASKSVEAWGALIGGYTRQGDSDSVFDLLESMKLDGVQPSGVEYLCALTVCSHVGLVEKGRKYFELLRTESCLSPTLEHYTCMMDLLGRAGHLEEALQMVKTMPFPPDGAVWHTLLGACRKWNNVEVGRQIFELAVSGDGHDAALYVLMSNIYASCQMWEEAKEMQVRRVSCGAWKKQGQSWCCGIQEVVHGVHAQSSSGL